MAKTATGAAARTRRIRAIAAAARLLLFLFALFLLLLLFHLFLVIAGQNKIGMPGPNAVILQIDPRKLMFAKYNN